MRSLYVCGFVALCLHVFHIRIVSVCLIRISGLQGRAARRLHERDEGVLLDHRFDSADRIGQLGPEELRLGKLPRLGTFHIEERLT